MLSTTIDIINKSDQKSTMTWQSVQSDCFGDKLRDAMEEPMDNLDALREKKYYWTPLVHETYLELKKLLRKEDMIRNFNSTMDFSSDEDYY